MTEELKAITQYKEDLEADLITQGRMASDHKVRLVCPVEDDTYKYEVALPLVSTKIKCSNCESELMVVHASQEHYQDDTDGEEPPPPDETEEEDLYDYTE